MSASRSPKWIGPLALIAGSGAQIALILAGAAAVAACAGAALGMVPWLSLPLTLQDGTGFEAGPGIQIGLAALMLSLCLFLPASSRVMRLEASHRRFQVTMEDVTRAYYTAHAADRKGVFRFETEFDAVRERLTFLRNHPELSALEPDVLELAAQMSHVARDMAAVYSDDKVATAREALNHRGDIAAKIEADVARATRITAELTAQMDRVEDQEAQTGWRIDSLRAELDELLPRLGIDPDQVGKTDAKASDRRSIAVVGG